MPLQHLRALSPCPALGSGSWAVTRDSLYFLDLSLTELILCPHWSWLLSLQVINLKLTHVVARVPSPVLCSDEQMSSIPLDGYTAAHPCVRGSALGLFLDTVITHAAPVSTGVRVFTWTHLHAYVRHFLWGQRESCGAALLSGGASSFPSPVSAPRVPGAHILGSPRCGGSVF